ncbi:LON peptidase substrate-binding domain-containing protein [Saccharothrix sp. AJ9571]|nr:LON peptidase substrate-binding domain-containing protein [Saccharothrix sp. AJ9571]
MADGAAGDSTGTTTLPLFPLQTVLLPGAHLPLHIFEPRYRQLTVDLVTGTVPDQEFGVIAMRTSLTREVTGLDQVHAIGCTTRLREAKRLPDGRFDVVTTGQKRFRLLDIDSEAAPYLVGTVEWVSDDPLPRGSGEAGARMAEVARGAHRRYCRSAWEHDAWSEPPADTSMADLAYQLAADCLLPMDDRQALLEQTQPLRRLRDVCRLLTRETGFLTTLRAVPAPPAELSALTRPASLN